MRLLVPTRISLALRWATIPPVSRGFSTTSALMLRKPPPHVRSAMTVEQILLEMSATLKDIRHSLDCIKDKDKISPKLPVSSAARVVAAAAPFTQLQQLWELSKPSSGEVDSNVKLEMEKLINGEMDEERLVTILKKLSNHNDFASIEKLLEAHARDQRKEKVPNEKLASEVLWAAARAKSLGALPSSILDWIEKEFQRLPDLRNKKSIIWSLSIVRGDLSTLKQLQLESSKKKGVVGPKFHRDDILRHAALVYLEAGENEEFRSLWTASNTPVLIVQKSFMQQFTAMLHHALLRRTKSGKPDPEMLQWYLEALSENMRVPIPANPQFEMMMAVVKALGGKIEKWSDNDSRKEKLRKWRDDYDDDELDCLVESLLDYMRYRIERGEGCIEDLNRLKIMLARLSTDDRRGRNRTVVVDWLNCSFKADSIKKPCPSHSVIVVGRERGEADCGSKCTPPEESDRIKVMEVTSKKDNYKQEMDDLCSIILAVATRGHLLTNDVAEPELRGFEDYLENESKDVRQLAILKNYLEDAWLRHHTLVQPAVDHSRAAQWIDNEKKELAFTVARKPEGSEPSSPYRLIDYYSVRIG